MRHDAVCRDEQFMAGYHSTPIGMEGGFSILRYLIQSKLAIVENTYRGNH